ncbi:MAG: rhodanese-like domain-containing protein [Pseudomonadota bacterium]
MGQLVEFTNNHLVLSAGLVISLFFVLYTEFRLQATAGINLSVPDAIRLLNQDAVVVDIRPAEQFKKGHITGSRNLTPDEVSASEERLKGLSGRDIIIACQSGMQCNRVVASLRNKGFDRVFSLKGGIDAWTAEKLPLVDTTKRKSKGKKDKRNKRRG